MVGGISPTWSPTKLGMDSAYIFGMLFGAEKRLSSPHLGTLFYSS